MSDLMRCALAFFRRDAALALSYPLAFALGVLSTVGRVLVLWLPAQLLADSRLFAEHGGFLPYSVVGTSMMGLLMASYGGFAGAIRGEQAMGTLESVLMTPATLPAVVIGSNLWTVGYALLDSLVTLGAGSLFFGLKFSGSPFGAGLVVLLTNLSFAAVGILSASFTVVYKRGDPFRVVVGAASFLMGGVIYPAEVLPGWIQAIAQILPVTHGARTLRGILIEGRDLSEFHFELLVLTAFALVGIPLAILAFSRALRRAKRDGSLLQY